MTRRAIAVAIALAASSPAFGGAAEGEKLFRLCQACHQIGEGAANRTGPHLDGVVGRVAGSDAEFRYSRAMKAAGEGGLVWTEAALDTFLADPRGTVKGTKMSYPGMKDAGDRADLIAYLVQESGGAAAPLPEVAAILAIEGDVDYGAYLGSECTACHQISGSDDGIPGIVGREPADFVTALLAYKDGSRENPAMKLVADRLGHEEIAALAAYFGGL